MAWDAKDLQVVYFVCAAHGEWNNVIEIPPLPWVNTDLTGLAITIGAKKDSKPLSL